MSLRCLASAVVAFTSLMAGPLSVSAFAQAGDHPPPPRAAPLKPVEVTESLPPPREGVIVFGGNRDTGLEVVKNLVARGEKVTVMVRPSSDKTELEKLGVTLVEGDAMDAASTEKAAKSQYFKAAVSTLGGSGTDPNKRPDFEGNKNAVDGAKAAGIPRFVLVTVIGTGTSKSSAPLFSRFVLRKVLPLKEQAENHLIASGLKYTIIRPGGLLKRAPEGKSVLTEDASKFSWMIRADLGKLTADAVYDDATINKIYTAFDASRDTFFSGLLERLEEDKEK